MSSRILISLGFQFDSYKPLNFVLYILLKNE